MMNQLRFVLSALFLSFCLTGMAMPVKSMVILGDSLSDNGNTTHLLKSLRQEESPAYLVRPLKVFVINKMIEYANAYYIPQMVLDAGIKMVTDYFDQEFGPMLAQLMGRIRLAPILPGKPYWHDRFSNGYVWNEYLADMLAVNRDDEEVYLNRAFGGSWALTYDYQLTTWNLIRHPIGTLKTLIVGKLIPPSLGLITQAHLMQNEALDDEAIYFIFAGANDYISMLNFDDNYNPAIRSTYIDNVLDALSVTVSRLAHSGVKRFVVLGLPDIGKTPRFVHTSDEAVLHETILQHNQRLSARLEQWKLDNPDVDFLYVDAQASLERIAAHPSAYGFGNISEACIDVKLPKFEGLAQSPFAGNPILQYAEVLQYKSPDFGAQGKNYHICNTPDSYLFWDETHPSTRAHRYLAFEVCETMKAHGYEIHCVMSSQ